MAAEGAYLKMTFLKTVRELLTDPSKPENRIVRKSMMAFCWAYLGLAFYRHVNLGLSSVESAFVTFALLPSMLFLFFFGGVLCGSFYRDVRVQLGGTQDPPSLSDHFAEWGVALAPSSALFLVFLLT